MARFAEVGLPASRDEEWRHGNVGAIVGTGFSPVLDPHPGAVTTLDLGDNNLADLVPTQLVFVDGHFAPELSTIAELPQGVRVESLGAALEGDPDLVQEHLGRGALCDAGFAALNTAFIRDGAFVYVPAGASLGAVHLLYVSTGRRASGDESHSPVSHPRTLIVIGEGARASVVETYAAVGASPTYLTNAVTEMTVGENAVLEHVEVQRESVGAFHVGTTHVTERRGCTFTSHSLALQGGFIRNDVTTVLDGPGIDSTLNGLYLGAGEEHIDNRTLIEHAQPHSASQELYKGILAGRSRGVFRGRIHVHEDAQETRAYQSNQNLLLSDEAEVDSMPQLEIYADDVKCSHGSTTGQLSPEAIFYLRSRGVSRSAAVGILTRAFAGEVLERIRHEAIRQWLEQVVLDKLATGLAERAAS